MFFKPISQREICPTEYRMTFHARRKCLKFFPLEFSTNYFYEKKKKNSESHVCSLKTGSEHVAVKYGMNGNPLLVFMNLG